MADVSAAKMAAFNAASGVHVGDLGSDVKVAFVTIVLMWAVICFSGLLVALPHKSSESEIVTSIVKCGFHVAIVITVVLYLVN